jgi:ATP-binding cassette subfamily C (CFTR/MRP) protein 1
LISNSTCTKNIDNVFGPQVHGACRSFDFTLLFEDEISILLPAAVLLLMLPSRIQILGQSSVKLTTMKLAPIKQDLLTVALPRSDILIKLKIRMAILISLQVVFLAFQLKTGSLKTKLSLSGSLVALMSTFAATYTSFMEDQRSVARSDMLILFFSASSILNLPRLRSY